MIHMKVVTLLQLANVRCLRFSWYQYNLGVIINVVPLMTLPRLWKCQWYCSTWLTR